MEQSTIEVGVEGGVEPPSGIFNNRYDDLPYLKYDDGGHWRDRAKCLGLTELTSRLFFPELGRGKKRKPVIEEARKFCSDCPVRKECFNFAKQNEMVDGIWGGVDFLKHVRKHLKEPIPDSID